MNAVEKKRKTAEKIRAAVLFMGKVYCDFPAAATGAVRASCGTNRSNELFPRRPAFRHYRCRIKADSFSARFVRKASVTDSP
jgi:hypothetical protein